MKAQARRKLISKLIDASTAVLEAKRIAANEKDSEMVKNLDALFLNVAAQIKNS